MIFKNTIEDILGTRSKIAILRLLSTGQELSGNLIAKQLQMSPWSCHRTLQELVNLGIIDMEARGRRYLFALNRSNRTVSDLLLSLFRKEAGFLGKILQSTLTGISDSIISLYLFGSVARGDETPFSGIDLLMVVPDAETKARLSDRLLPVRIQILQEYGNLIQPYLVTPLVLQKALSEQHPIVQKILAEGRLIHGKELADAAADPTEGRA